MLELRQRSRERGVSLRAIINGMLRLGLARRDGPHARVSYRCPTYAMGQPRISTLDKALSLAADLESEEAVRKMKLRK